MTVNRNLLLVVLMCFVLCGKADAQREAGVVSRPACWVFPPMTSEGLTVDEVAHANQEWDKLVHANAGTNGTCMIIVSNAYVGPKQANFAWFVRFSHSDLGYSARLDCVGTETGVILSRTVCRPGSLDSVFPAIAEILQKADKPYPSRGLITEDLDGSPGLIRLAVLDVSVKTDTPLPVATLTEVHRVLDGMESVLINDPDITVVERHRLKLACDVQDLSSSGAIPFTIAHGHIVPSRYVISPQVAVTSNNVIQLSLKLLDTVSGQMKKRCEFPVPPLPSGRDVAQAVKKTLSSFKEDDVVVEPAP